MKQHAINMREIVVRRLLDLTDEEIRWLDACTEAITRAPDSVMVPEGEPFYVVERFVDGRSAGCWDGGGSRSFQYEIDKAVQFRRREDAFWATRGWHWRDTQITEHMMLQSQPKAVELCGPCCFGEADTAGGNW